MKTIISAENQILDAAAAQIKKTLLVRKNAVLALAGGRSVRGLYERLLRMYDCGEISFAGVRALALTELLDVPENMSCRKVILDNFLCKTDISTANVHFPDPEHPEHYEELIAECGGIDIAVLGIGENAHIGYNEPATPFASVTHVQKLTDATRHQLEKQHPYAEKLPEKAVTMGIKTNSNHSKNHSNPNHFHIKTLIGNNICTFCVAKRCYVFQKFCTFRKIGNNI